MHRSILSSSFLLFSILAFLLPAHASETRLLRSPTISESHISFEYGGDIWLADLSGNNVKRLTSTSAVEREPHFSPDGKTIAFSSNRSGSYSVYSVSIDGGKPTRLTWHADAAFVRGWTPDGAKVLFSSGRDTAPRPIHRLWTVPASGGPASLVNQQWATNGAYSTKGDKLVIDRMQRWDQEWRHYRGGQNTALVVLDLSTNEEIKIPNEASTDVEPVWLDEHIYFISDRAWVANVWAFSLSTGQLEQITFFEQDDVKQLSSNGKILAFEQNGYLYTLDPKNKKITRLSITVKGDFPWAETQWEALAQSARAGTLSPTGKRAVFQARGEIFTVPIENGNVRNLSQSSGVADRKPIWSPLGDTIAWFSDQGGEGYRLVLQAQDGLSAPEFISIGESKMAWEPKFSPDGKHIAFVDDDVRIRVLTLANKKIQTVDVGGTNIERGNNGIAWSPDSRWLAYSKAGSNSFRQIWLWSLDNEKTSAVTNRFADSHSASWDLSGKHLYFLASTDIGLQSGWANTSSMGTQSQYLAYVINLNIDEPSPFAPKSDEEPAQDNEDNGDNGKEDKKEDASKDEDLVVNVDFENIERRIFSLPLSPANYAFTVSGPAGQVFIAERADSGPMLSLHKFVLEDAKATKFIGGVRSASISSDANHLLVNAGSDWKVLDTGGPEADDGKTLKLDLQMKLNRQEEWRQMFLEAWRYQRDYFYDPNMHGRDWDLVLERYLPLVEFVRHRSDLTYLLDMVNGELSVGHSFVFGGDFPETPDSKAGLLGADLQATNNGWQISRIFTAESWNPGLLGPLDQPGLDVSQGDYIVGINGRELSASDNIYKHLDGTLDTQTVLHINSKGSFEGARKITVVPTGSETNLRQRTWVEDNRRLVDKLSGGKLAYVWVPNTSSSGFVNFTRYFFGQQDKQGAVIDERFNGGGLLDDYMVDLMSRDLRAAITNEVPNGSPMQLPAGIKGPKVLLINELAGSGGDFFPWVFRQQKIGPLIGMTTWGGLVKSSVHYSLVDGGALTAPDNAIFDPSTQQWIAENTGVAPDIRVYQDAKSLNAGRDPQLERGVQEALKMLEQRKVVLPVVPPFPTPATRPAQ